MIIKNIEIITENYEHVRGSLRIENDTIAEISTGDLHTKQTIPVIDGQGLMAIPGFIDVHIHGADGHDTMDASRKALNGIATVLPREGTTSFLPTTMTQHPDAITAALENIADYMKENQAGNGAEVLGIHLEGPFISREKAGAQPEEFIRKPDISLFEKWQAASNNNIRLVTLAPEETGALALIAYLDKHGVVASIGHTNATYQEAMEAVNHGAKHVTHLFNQMSGLHHREPGVAGAALIRDELSLEVIADNVHVHPEAVHLAYRSKGAGKLMLITDAMRAKCLPNGSYELGGQAVEVTGNEVRLPDGTLAGSILTLQEAAKNMTEIADISIAELIKMTSENAARQLGIFDRKGSIRIGKDADLVLIDKNRDVVMTICRGEIAFEKEDWQA
ncbi:N-acetylglucosamine-6-phosphate deacetylase [Thalassobacillus pellis]|nr:N-acetylglucosamine-6-phosphate deacetylase [Thalassobacillus pellis]